MPSPANWPIWACADPVTVRDRALPIRPATGSVRDAFRPRTLSVAVASGVTMRFWRWVGGRGNPAIAGTIGIGPGDTGGTGPCPVTGPGREF